MNHLPKRFEALIDKVIQLPRIGKKSAMRLAMHLVEHKEEQIGALTESLQRVQTDLKFCRVCGKYSDLELCNIYSNQARKNGIICVVKSVKDLIAIEETGQVKVR